MSSTPSPPTTPPTSTAVADATPQPPQTSSSLRQRLRNLTPFVKGAFVAALILLAVALYVFTGHVSTDDAQVDCHITAVAAQVPGSLVQLFINDNNTGKWDDVPGQ